MSYKGYVATAGGFCVAISRKKTNTQQNAVNPTNTATESATPFIQATKAIKATSIKKSA